MAEEVNPWSREQWALAAALFGRILDGEAADAVRADAMRQHLEEVLAELIRRHERAERAGFLDEPPTLVRELAGDDRPVFAIGQTLVKRFNVLRLLGRGGMGEVYLAQDLTFNETVALKTIRRALAADGAIRERFLAEARAARKVAHPSVCRIFDHYDAEEGPFYSMDYLPGPTLAEVLHAGRVEWREAQRMALEIAEALQAAHRKEILHCDLKPGNVILAGTGRGRRAVLTDFGLAWALQGGAGGMAGGTRAFMAPELLAGGPPTVRTDIYAYGQLLRRLRPRHRVGDWCAAESPADRPASMDEVVAAVHPRATRRNLLIALTAGGVVAAAAAYEALARRGPLVGGRQRLVVSRIAPGGTEQSRVLRGLLVMALRQSPMLGLVPDDQVKGQAAGAGLPLDELMKAARAGASTLVLDGGLRPRGSGVELTLSLYESAGGKKIAEVTKSVTDGRQMARLAEQAAVALRGAIGESPESLGAPYAPLERVTSESPEAVSLYFRAAYLYERGIRASDTRSALDLLDQALRIDGGFALAYHLKALVLTATDRVAESEDAAVQALAHLDRLGVRERNWVEGFYRSIVGDFTGSAEAYRRNIALYPEEAVFRRQFAFAAARLGRYDEALAENRAAVKLAPLSAHCATELVVNLAEAGRAEEALETARSFVNQGLDESLFQRARGLALLQQDRLEEARVLFGRMQQGPAVSAIVCYYQSGPLALLGSFGEAERVLQAGLATGGTEDYAHLQARLSLGAVYGVTGRLRAAADAVRPVVELPLKGCYLRHVRVAGWVAARAGDGRLAWRAADWLRAYGRDHDFPHARGGTALAEAMAFEVDGDARAGSRFDEARAVWPDPLTLLGAARWAGSHGAAVSALEALEQLERSRGAVLKNYPAVLAEVGRMEMVKVLWQLSRFEPALRMYEQVRLHWGAASEPVPALRELRNVVRRRAG